MEQVNSAGQAEDGAKMSELARRQSGGIGEGFLEKG
jgi:hypothetical protein